MKNVLEVFTLGTFRLKWGEKSISCDINRAKRVWYLLAYILYHHKRPVPQSELIDLLWNDEKDRANPQSSLKTALYRARGFLEMLSPELSKGLIVYGSNGYSVSDEFAVVVDTDLFEEYAQSGKLADAVSLYKGDFLARLSSDAKTLPLQTYYRNMYFHCVKELLSKLYEEKRYEDGEMYCREALLADPYKEQTYQHLMKFLLAQDKKKEAVSVYEELDKLLLSNFGVVPAPESRELYREALKTVNRNFVHPGMVSEQLKETDPVTGALVCDYDFFRMLYRAEARLIARSGAAVHIALMSFTAHRGAELSQKVLERAMDAFEEHLRTSLRKGDVISRCSPGQFVVMLPNANFENSTMVCRRLIKAFEKDRPHSPAKIEFSVHPLEMGGGEEK